MANQRSQNIFYIDTQYAVAADELQGNTLRVKGVIVTATNNSARIVLTDSGINKLDLRVATSGATQHFDFSLAPITFARSIRPTVLSNAVVTVILDSSQG